jgi:hypothetical protein
MKQALSISLAVAGLVSVSLGYFAPILSDPVTRVAGGAGDPLLVGYLVTWVAEHLATADAWNPPFLYPASNVLAYSDHLYGLGVTAAPAVAAGLPVTLIVNGISWAAFALTSIALLVWLMDAPRGLWPACAAAITVSYCGWFTQQLSHPHLIFLPYLPLALLCIDRALARRGPLWLLALAAVLLSFQTLSATSLAVFLLPSVGAYIVLWLLFERGGRRMWMASGAALLAVVMANLPMAWRYWMLGANFERSPVEIARHSATWIDWISAPATHWLYGSRLAFTVGEERELYPGIGLFVLSLAGAAVAIASRSPTRTRTCSALIVAALALWASTGPSTRGFSIIHLPYDLLTAIVPGARNVRVPARFVILAAVFLAPAIADGWRAVFEWLERRLVLRPAAIIVGALLVVATVAEGLAGLARYERVTDAELAIPPREIKSGAVLFLPLLTPAGEIRRMWHARHSGVAVVNGYSGHPSYLWEAIRHLQRAELTDDLRRFFYSRLLAAGVDTVIVEDPGSPLVSDRYLQPIGERVFRIVNASITPLPRTIALGSGGGLLIPETGWSYPERSDLESWVWTVDRRAEMSVPMDGSAVHALELRVRALRNESPIELVWNGRSLGTRTVSSSTSVVRFDLPAEATRAGWTRFALEGPKPVRVRDSEDPRRLSVCVYEIALR